MRILVISQYYYPEPFRINEICEAFVSQGDDVLVITGLPNYPEGEIYDGYENAIKKEVINGVKIIRCKIRPRKTGNLNLALNYISFIISANRIINHLKGKYDIVYGYQLSPITSMIPAMKYSKMNKIPFYLYCLDLWPESIRMVINPKGVCYKIIEMISRKIYGSAHRIGVTSPSFIQYLSDLTNKKKHISYIPQHANDIKNSFAIEKKDKKKTDIVNFVFIGNVGSSQNINSVLSALSKVKGRNRLVFHIIGSGSELDNAKKECERLNISSSVIFYGRQPKERLSEFYSIADVCIVSLRNEGLIGNTIPGKLQEYMSSGTAILAYMNGDASRIVADSNCGYIVPAENESELTKTIQYIIDNRDELVELGKNARNYYINNFTLDKHVKTIKNELFELTTGDLS